MFSTRQIQLLEEAKDPPGGAPGGDAKPFTDDQLKALGGIINGALKSEGKRLVASAVTEAVSQLKIGETIAAEVAKLKPADPPDAKPGEGKPDPKVTALETKVQELTTKLQQDAEALKKAQEASRDKDALAALKTALGPLVRPEALEIAARDLFLAQKRVTFDDAGNPLLTVRRAAFAGGAEEDVALPLADGVQHWVKSPEGKFFAPAPGGGAGNEIKGGAPRRVNLGGDGQPKYDQPATTDAEKLRRASEREQAIRQRYPELK
jgi:hypothetical protein